MLGPVLFIILYSFNPSAYFSLPMTGLSLKWFVNFFENERFMNAFWVSMKMAAIVTPLSIVISIPTAYALVRCEFRGQNLVNALIMSPIVIPGVVSGIALLIYLSAIGVGPGFTGLVIGMTCFSIPFGVRALVANMHGLRPELEEVARNLGASNWSVFWRIVLPQLRPGLLAGGTFVFVEAIDNFSISVFLSTTKVSPLPVEGYSYIRDFDDPTVAAMAVILIAISTGLVLLASRMVGLNRMFRVE
ncbi:ABC transporter permease [Parapusillimonas granuli]|uniref:ABC transporter permease n=1 Tax=Parapusillimonas granuli TaxID=380911 RepID=A0A853G238_9BURK|nr:ABC transporter permease [Parapusillimonas granuli]MBB5214284.1 putative spermidine/putrescine transport system permease protein [Parapusillimonas granuli]NYT51388.1 ABC transporter permease [Parapusillimonas granuli]